MTRPDDLQDEDYALLASFRRSLRVFLDFSAEAAREAGLTPQHHQAILAIRGLAPPGGTTINDLASHLLLKPHTAAELAERLEKAGLVTRRRDEADRRRVLLQLTAQAEDVLASLSKAHLAQIRRDGLSLSNILAQIVRS